MQLLCSGKEINVLPDYYFSPVCKVTVKLTPEYSSFLSLFTNI